MLEEPEECGFIHSYVAYGKESQGMLNNKIESFRNATSTRCSLHLTMITTFGVSTMNTGTLFRMK
ncbi:MAG: hypothetical protein MR923_13995 [Prevotella sp.]|nr:hypothetical protein [Prevotella sp.]